MDKSWMHKSRLSKEYELSVENFIKFGFSNTSTSYIHCPCLKCGNCEKHSRKDARDHLYVNVFKRPKWIEKLLIDAKIPLYEGYKKYTKLSTLVKLYNLKVRYGWSDISFSELLKTLKEILPTTNELPNSLYEAKKTLGALGMEYEKIHACPNNCCLYRKEFANATECPECGQSRWKNVKDRNEERKQILSKVIWSVLLWTINDFPAYANLSGYCVKGYKACPICGDNTNFIRLRNGKKIAYLGHRRFLARDHLYQRQKKSFNGKKELGTIPEPLSGEDVYLKLKDLEFPKGKKIHKNLSMNRSEKICWNRLSSFFELPYWKDLHVRHCLDVMHIEKNVCMNILGTLLDIPGKSKDGLNARHDLVDLRLRPELAPISSEKKISIPPTCYTFTKEKKNDVF
ncbi:hypothetical protein IC582_010814 [Cucumis melo]